MIEGAGGPAGNGGSGALARTPAPLDSSVRPVLSIVVPIRNRIEKLPACLRTIQRAGLPPSRIEVVVSDNSPRGTQLAREFLDDPCIRVIRAPSPLHMTDNFDLGLREARGQWVMFLGSDDGVLSHRLATYIDHLTSTRQQCVTGPTVAFMWPDLSSEGAGRVSWWTAPQGQSKVLSARKELERVRRSLTAPGRLDSSRLPMPYMHGAVRIEVLDHLNEIAPGPVFRTQTPDIYIMMALLHCLQSYEVLPWAIGIQGSSRDSNGRLALAQPDVWRALPDRQIGLSDAAVGRFGRMDLNTDIVLAYGDAFHTAREVVSSRNRGETAPAQASCQEPLAASRRPRRTAHLSRQLDRFATAVSRLRRASRAAYRLMQGASYTYASSTALRDSVDASEMVANSEREVCLASKGRCPIGIIRRQHVDLGDPVVRRLGGKECPFRKRPQPSVMPGAQA
jgi:hypothetical protein